MISILLLVLSDAVVQFRIKYIGTGLYNGLQSRMFLNRPVCFIHFTTPTRVSVTGLIVGVWYGLVPFLRVCLL